jgi:hypothetical protein
MDVRKRKFTLPEICQAANVTEATLRNWLKRDVIDMGQLVTARKWLFSAKEAIALRALSGLVALGVSPAVAEEACELVGSESIAYRHKTLDKSFKIIICINQYDGSMRVSKAVRGQGMNLMIDDPSESTGWTRNPIIEIPVFEIIEDTLAELEKIAGDR